MDNRPEEFEKLRKLLKIKQHEQPPPGYFNNFSSLVINRIERDGSAHAALIEVPWLRKLFGMFERSPVVGGLFGSALCAVVILGITLANQVDKVPQHAWRPQGLANNNNANASDSGAFSTTAAAAAASPVAMFGSNAPDSSVSVQTVNFTTTAPH